MLSIIKQPNNNILINKYLTFPKNKNPNIIVVSRNVEQNSPIILKGDLSNLGNIENISPNNLLFKIHLTNISFLL